jgi:hypothetical protein
MAGFGALLLWAGQLYIVLLAAVVLGRMMLFYVRSECPEWVPFAVSAAKAAAPLTVEVVAWLVLWSVSSWITVGLGVVVGWCVLRGRVLEWWSGPPALSAVGWTEDDAW